MWLYHLRVRMKEKWFGVYLYNRQYYVNDIEPDLLSLAQVEEAIRQLDHLNEFNIQRITKEEQ